MISLNDLILQCIRQGKTDEQIVTEMEQWRAGGRSVALVGTSSGAATAMGRLSDAHRTDGSAQGPSLHDDLALVRAVRASLAEGDSGPLGAPSEPERGPSPTKEDMEPTKENVEAWMAAQKAQGARYYGYGSAAKHFPASATAIRRLLGKTR